MAYIKVDYNDFQKAADAIDEYVDLMNSKMNAAQEELLQLSGVWQGADSVLFHSRWELASGSDSTHRKMLTAMRSYSRFLKFARGSYREAQAKALERANALPNY